MIDDDDDDDESKVNKTKQNKSNVNKASKFSFPAKGLLIFYTNCKDDNNCTTVVFR
jgi:hypothetical protein